MIIISHLIPCRNQLRLFPDFCCLFYFQKSKTGLTCILKSCSYLTIRDKAEPLKYSLWPRSATLCLFLFRIKSHRVKLNIYFLRIFVNFCTYIWQNTLTLYFLWMTSFLWANSCYWSYDLLWFYSDLSLLSPGTHLLGYETGELITIAHVALSCWYLAMKRQLDDTDRKLWLKRTYFSSYVKPSDWVYQIILLTRKLDFKVIGLQGIYLHTHLFPIDLILAE